MYLLKAQFALLEVLASFIILLLGFSILIKYYYLNSLNSYYQNIMSSNLYYDFFQSIYKNQTMSNCIIKLDHSNNFNDTKCMVLLNLFSNIYNFNLEVSINNNKIKTQSFQNCTEYNLRCTPFNVGNFSYKQVCLGSCIN
jgi:hypothetical protein